MLKKAFTLLELLFVIVIIGVLASVAIPKFAGLSDNAKISAELSTAASVQVALDACHGEWIINEGTFTCGKDIDSASLNANGYPASLDSGGSALAGILKQTPSDWSVSGSNNYTGPASGSHGAGNCKTGKPCTSKHWHYDATEGTFLLANN